MYIDINISTYNLLSPYNVTCIYVFKVHHLALDNLLMFSFLGRTHIAIRGGWRGAQEEREQANSKGKLLTCEFDAYSLHFLAEQKKQNPPLWSLLSPNFFGHIQTQV